MKKIVLSISILITLFSQYTTSLKHHLVLTNDHRIYFTVSSFGYLRSGFLEVTVQNLTFLPDISQDSDTKPKYGFFLFKSDLPKNPFIIDQIEAASQSRCLLDNPRNYLKNKEMTTLVIDPLNNITRVNCWSKDYRSLPPIKPLTFYNNHHPHDIQRRSEIKIESDKLDSRGINSLDDIRPPEIAGRKDYRHCSPDLPLMKHVKNGVNSYSFNFSMLIEEPYQEGLYYLTFHNCRGRISMMPIDPTNPTTSVNLSLQIDEKNYPHNYLSAGDKPLPQMFFILSVMFFLSGCIWINFISRQRESTLKIHTLMSVLVFTKSCSLLMHGINYHFIAVYGQQVVTWAYIYYVTRSIKGALFFITLALIGSGWSFIKHMLSDKDKKIIMFIFGLQVIAHIAEVVIDESSEGEASNEFWTNLCSLVDLFSCVAILYPIGWSVRHLEEASRTDGKAAINLKRLELFKRFFIISTIYIYITKIVSFVPLSVLSFRYSWLADLVTEISTFVYFIVTGCYFQPVPTNPYLLLSTDNDLDEDVLFSMETYDGNTGPDEVAYKGTNQSTNEGEGQQKVIRRLIDDIV